MMTKNVRDLKTYLDLAATGLKEFLGRDYDEKTLSFAVDNLISMLHKYNDTNNKHIKIKGFSILVGNLEIYRQAINALQYLKGQYYENDKEGFRVLCDSEKEYNKRMYDILVSDEYMPKLIRLLGENEVNRSIALYGVYELSLPSDITSSWVNTITFSYLSIIMKFLAVFHNHTMANQQDLLSLGNDLLNPWLNQYPSNQTKSFFL